VLCIRHVLHKHERDEYYRQLNMHHHTPDLPEDHEDYVAPFKPAWADWKLSQSDMEQTIADIRASDSSFGDTKDVAIVAEEGNQNPLYLVYIETKTPANDTHIKNTSPVYVCPS
jgi:hypothetical protein